MTKAWAWRYLPPYVFMVVFAFVITRFDALNRHWWQFSFYCVIVVVVGLWWTQIRYLPPRNQ